MASGTLTDLSPPDSWEDLETIVADVARRELADPLAVEHGRRGQDQDGVDVYAQPDEELYVGFQCKDMESLSKGEIEDEIEKAEDFEPGLDDFVIVWSGRRDKNLQEDVRELSAENDGEDGFRVGLWFWDDVSDILQRHPDLLQIHASKEQTDYRTLTSAGCYRLSETHFDRAESRELPEVWRRGIRPKDVRDDYVADRRVDVSDEDDDPEWVSVTDVLTKLLEEEDVMVRAPPGCGKSAICHSVAVEWYERGKGAVFVRRSGKSEFPETDVLEQFVRAADGHVLVVVEDAVRDETRDVYELMYDLSDLDGVSFLLDGRIGEYKDFDPAPRKDTTEASEFRKILHEETNHVGVPLLDPGECEQLRDLFDEETGSETDLSGEHLLRRAASRGRAGEMLHLAYHLLGSSDGGSGLEEDVRDKFESLNDPSESNVQRTELREYDKDLRLRVGILLNLLNLAGVQLRREFVRALPSVMDEDYSTATMDDLLYDGLGGWMVFGDRDHPRMTPQHEFWSMLFLRHIVEGPRGEDSSHGGSGPPVTRSVAIEAVTDCVNAVVAVLDDEELRSAVWSRNDPTELREELEESPEEKASDYLGRLFRVGQNWPILSPLFGSIDDDAYAIHEVDVCPDWLLAETLAQWGDVLRKNNDLQGQEREEGVTRAFEQAIETLGDASTDREKQAEANVLGGYATFFHARGEYEAAIERMERALELREEISHRAGEATTLNNLGTVHEARGQWAAAEEYYEDSLAIKREIGDRAVEAATLNNLGEVHEARGEWAAAEEYYEDSLAIEREIGDRAGEAATLDNVGQIYHNRGELDAAEEYYTEALAIRREIGDRAGEATTLDNVGQIYHHRGELDTAEEYYEDSLAIKHEIGDREGEATTLINLGEVHRARGQWAAAEANFKESLRIYREIGHLESESKSLGNLGHVFDSRGELDEAAEKHREALEIQRDIGDRQAEAVSHGNLGAVLSKKGDHETAYEHLNDAVEILFDIGDVRQGLTALSHLVDVCEALGKSDEAREHCERALETIENADLPGLDDEQRRFREQYAQLSARDDEQAIFEHYVLALESVVNQDAGGATRMFAGAWGRRSDIEPELDAHRMVLASGVGLAAYLSLLESVDSVQVEIESGEEKFDSELETVLEEVEPHREELPVPAEAVFEVLHEGSTDISEDDIEAYIAEDEGDEEDNSPSLREPTAGVFTFLHQQVQNDD